MGMKVSRPELIETTSIGAAYLAGLGVGFWKSTAELKKIWKLDREFKVKMKLNPIPEMLKDQRVVVVDDSIVRGNTARSRVRAIRKAGAKEVHLRISCPPHKFPCYYGIDFPDPNELLANQKSMDEIRKFLDADSVGYLSIEGMLKAVSGAKDEYCTCCFSGQYPVPVKDHFDKHTIEKGLR
jgi:amidophosphoribosyltransferase